MAASGPPREALEAISEIDRTVHAPARLAILAILSVVESADFTFLMRQTGLTRGNLSSHLSKLEAAAYIEVVKTYAGRTPRTLISLTEAGRTAVETYREKMRQVVDQLLAPAG